MTGGGRWNVLLPLGFLPAFSDRFTLAQHDLPHSASLPVYIAFTLIQLRAVNLTQRTHQNSYERLIVSDLGDVLQHEILLWYLFFFTEEL